MIEQGFTVTEWEQLLRLNESDPQAAVKRFLTGISRPIDRKSKYPMVKPERREYNLAVNVLESGDRLTAINLLESFATTTSTFCNGVIRFNGLSAKRKERAKVNIFAKIFNSGTNPLNPVAANDRDHGEYPDIEPGNIYEGFVYFPYLAKWLQGGRLAQLLGV